MQEFSISFIISGLLAWIIISLYYYVRNKEIRAVQNALIDIYDFDKKMDIRYYRLRAIYALMVYKYHTCVTRPEFKYIVLGALVKQPWMKKFIREDLKGNPNEPLKSIAARLSLVDTIPYNDYQDEISKFINDPDRFEWITVAIKAVDNVIEDKGNSEEQKTLFDLLSEVPHIYLYMLTVHLFGINLPFSFFKINPSKGTVASANTLRNMIYNKAVGGTSPASAIVDIHPYTNRRALYRERALSSGSVMVNINTSDDMCQVILTVLSILRDRIDGGVLVTAYDFFDALGMIDNFDKYSVKVVNTLGENRHSPLIDKEKFPLEEALEELNKIKITALDSSTRLINASNPLIPNSLTAVFEYSRIGRVYNKKSKESQD